MKDNYKMNKIDYCANCGKYRALYMKIAVQVIDKILTLESEKPCCRKCFEKEVKKQLKEGAAHVG